MLHLLVAANTSISPETLAGLVSVPLYLWGVSLGGPPCLKPSPVTVTLGAVAPGTLSAAAARTLQASGRTFGESAAKISGTERMFHSRGCSIVS